MQSAALADRLILIVDDEPLIAMDLVQTFETAGAKVVHASSLREALALSEKADLAVAVVDHILNDGDTTALCGRLRQRAIPFLIYTGYPALEGYSDDVLLSKPAMPDQLLTKVLALLHGGTGNGAQQL